MAMRSKLVMGSLTVLAAWAAPQRASACSYIHPCLMRPTLVLVGDVTARPLNACIAVQYAGAPWYGEPITPELAYVASDGTRIALAATDTLRVFCPTELLAADTDHVLVGPESTEGCGVGAEVELLTFHTGATLDTTPPSAPGTVEDVWCAHDVCDSSSCCGPYDVIAHQSMWDVATDDGAEVAYVVDGELRVFSTHRWSDGRRIQPIPVWVFDDEPHDVRAIDVAGNIGEPALHGAPCVPAPIEPDAGVPDAFSSARHDASTSVVDAAMPSGGGGGGCTVAARDDEPTHARVMLFVILGLVARRRRR